MASAAAILYVCGSDSNGKTAANQRGSAGVDAAGGVNRSERYRDPPEPARNEEAEKSFDVVDPGQNEPLWRAREDEGGAAGASGLPSHFSEDAVKAALGTVESYAEFARKVLQADELAVQQGRPLQGKYIVLDSGNELANRLRGVISGFFLGVLVDRVFVADITYQKDGTKGLLSALFDGPGYEWDLSKLSPQLRRALASNKSQASSGRVRSSGSVGANLLFDMSKEHFQHWVCDDVVEQVSPASGPSIPVVTLSTVVYPLPLLARNPAYASHPIFQAAVDGDAKVPPTKERSGGNQQLLEPGGMIGQRRIEALETLLTRIVLRPKRELRERARELAGSVRAKAEEWGRNRGLGAGRGSRPVRIVGLHVRTYFVRAVSTDTLENNLKHFDDCAVAGNGGGEDEDDAADETFYFVATDEANTQAVAKKMWGDGCYFVPFGLPGSKLEGIKAAVVDLLVMGSFDDYVMTPHSSFSELGATLSHTWLPDPEAALRTSPNRPIVPLFPQMNEFERRKAFSLLDRRAAEILPSKRGWGVAAAGTSSGWKGMCMRTHAAGMSVTVAKGRQLLSMFEAIEDAPCVNGRKGGHR